jgi:hypothetical protein
MNVAARKNCKGSKYKGVWKETRRGKDVWRGRIKTSAGGKARIVNCGSHASELSAALAYDSAQRKLVEDHAGTPLGVQMRRASRYNLPRAGERSAL